MKLPYGEGHLDLPYLPQEFTQTLEPSLALPPLHLGQALEAPLRALKRLLTMATPRHVAVLVEDRTRKNRELPDLLRAIGEVLAAPERALSLVVGYGAHGPHTFEEHAHTYGRDNLERFQVVDHLCRASDTLSFVGQLASGQACYLNRVAVEADFRIVIGSIEPHVFAGFTGGRKMILPGIADYESIRRNHARVQEPFQGLGRLEGNPIHLEMDEAARLLPIHFAFQLVRDGRGDAVALMGGDLNPCFEEGVALCREINTCRVAAPADLVVVTPGGSPKDASLYQSNRAITAARRITRPGGTVLVVGAFPLGVGNREVEAWLRQGIGGVLSLPQAQIEVGGHNAVCLARNLESIRLVFETGWAPQHLEELGLIHGRHLAPNPKDLWTRLLEEAGPQSIRYLIPNGSCILCELA